MRAACLILLLATGCFSKPDRPGSSVDGGIDSGIDAGPDLCVPTKCTAAAGTCMDGTCVIEGGMGSQVKCPAGMPCHVLCADKDDCDYVLCQDATTCDVQCTNMNACHNGVSCGTADTCTITCVGMGACTGMGGLPSIGCNASTCDVTCNGKDACKNGIDTTAGGACTASCCGDGACNGGVDTCMKDNSCN